MGLLLVEPFMCKWSSVKTDSSFISMGLVGIVGLDRVQCDLANTGITGLALLWFKRYLTDRKLRVLVNEEHSE